jgi:AraC-like DNA-binding protein
LVTDSDQEDGMNYFLFSDLSRIHSDDCGCAMLNPGWIHMKRKLSESVIILGRKSSALLEDEGEPIEIRPNRICILSAGRLHQGKKAISEPVSYYWLHFTTPSDPVLLSDDEANTILGNRDVIKQRLSRAALVKQQIDLKDPEPFNRLFHDLLYEQERPSYTTSKFQVLVQQLLINATEATIAEHTLPRVLPAGSDLAYAILSLVAERLSDPNLSIKYIADLLRHNPDYVGRRFKRVMGLSIGEYVLQKRIELATLRLQETYGSVAAISAQCGFGSVRQFLRQFKAVQGITPSELRARYRTMYINSL